MASNSFWLGPVGGLVALPCPDTGVKDTLEKFGTTHQALSGKRTVDVMGYRRTWELNFPYLDLEQYGYLEACFMGMVVGPLRLYDPLRKNLLSAPASSTLSRKRWDYSTDAFSTEGACSYIPTSAPVVNGLPRLSTAVQVTGTGAGMLRVDPNYIPLVEGKTYTFSGYVAASSGSVTLDLVTGLAGTVHATNVITSSTMSRYSVSYTAQANDFLIPKVAVTASTTATVLALQLEEGTAPTAWVPGTGVPVVTIDTLEPESPRYPLQSVDVTFLEL